MRVSKPATFLCVAAGLALAAANRGQAEEQIDFNRQVRSILSNHCAACHGPDEKERQADLRLDTRDGATVDLGGYRAIVPGQPEKSELIARITSDDDTLRMPPADHGQRLSAKQIEVLKAWIRQGANYAPHWSYVPPKRPPLPQVKLPSWPKNAIDHFVLAHLEQRGLKPSAAADRYAILRRVSLDLTGLPPSPQEVQAFLQDDRPGAYERLVDRLLAKPAYGERWAAMWLDLARYADSAGYADDPPRTIWAYRDYVIRSFNQNKPFDQFTIEQIAGDLLPDPAQQQLVATAFHRNTLTNSEGGTNDEEFRNVAIVDRVNTTMAVWMGTTMACAQCHNHKYDPISQEEYFQFFAFFNNTADADRRNEQPVLEIYSAEQKQQKAQWLAEAEQLKQKLNQDTPELQKAQQEWEARLRQPLEWQPLKLRSAKAKGGTELNVLEDGSLLAAGANPKQNVYTLEFAPPRQPLTALRIEALPDESLPQQGPGRVGNFVLSQVTAVYRPPESEVPTGRFVRIDLPGKDRILSLAEVQIFSEGNNIAPAGKPKQSSVAYDGPARLAIDGNTDGHYSQAKSTTHTNTEKNPWWEVDLGGVKTVERIAVWNRTDGNLESRLKGLRVSLLDAKRNVVWQQEPASFPAPSATYQVRDARPLTFSAAHADFSQKGFSARDVLSAENADKGWAIAPQIGKPHWLAVGLDVPVTVQPDGSLVVTLKQNSKYDQHTLGRLRVSYTTSPQAPQQIGVPQDILQIVQADAAGRKESEQQKVAEYFRSNAPQLKPQRQRLAAVEKQLANLKPSTTVPIFAELPEGKRRTTRIQIRGNFLDTGKVVQEAVPSVFHAFPEGAPKNRLTLARWLVDADNPLTSRVLVNRYWEKLFGTGLVATSEEFGAQGELPTHPELLDWLAVEFRESGWDLKHLLKLMVTSATYRQSAKVTPELAKEDPYNRLLSRGPRVRLSAEMVRDQALFASGLLSDKMFGPPVQPPRPKLGLKAAFGGSTDWKNSQGEDRYRRAIYTEWRRSMPYPSMSTFDAPSREVCTISRSRTNTPLQALVTLNDPVYVEAAQALARRVLREVKENDPPARAEHAFRLCMIRPPSKQERDKLVKLFQSARQRFAAEPENAKALASEPLGPPPKEMDVADLAAWTVVANVIMNLDEMIQKR